MKATQLEYGKFQASIFKLGRELGDSGAEVLTRIDEDDKFRSKVASYMLRGATELPVGGVTARVAKAIMGEDKTIGPDQIQKFFDIVIDPKVLELADRVPYRPETLARCSTTHLLVFGCPVTIRDIADKSQMGIQWRLPKIMGENEEPSMVTSLPTQGWFLINRFASETLAANERLATVVEAYYALSLHKETNKRQYFFKDGPSVCQETAEGGEVYFALGQIFVGAYKPGAYRYWAVKEVSKNTQAKIIVVLPDDPIN
ncbi:MAG: hypothetical protein WC027_02780 [Candidatus Paceibacterota bacterium]